MIVILVASKHSLKKIKEKKKKNSNLSSYGTLEFETRILIITKMV
jgi:hypothetical protein